MPERVQEVGGGALGRAEVDRRRARRHHAQGGLAVMGSSAVLSADFTNTDWFYSSADVKTCGELLMNQQVVGSMAPWTEQPWRRSPRSTTTCGARSTSTSGPPARRSPARARRRRSGSPASSPRSTSTSWSTWACSRSGFGPSTAAGSAGPRGSTSRPHGTSPCACPSARPSCWPRSCVEAVTDRAGRRAGRAGRAAGRPRARRRARRGRAGAGPRRTDRRRAGPGHQRGRCWPGRVRALPRGRRGAAAQLPVPPDGRTRAGARLRAQPRLPRRRRRGARRR